MSARSEELSCDGDTVSVTAASQTAAEDASRALEVMRAHPLGAESARIGDPLPRIC